MFTCGRRRQPGCVGGTSCAAPLWAAFTALVNQQAVANGKSTVGFINPAVYAIGLSSELYADFHDITTGNNFSSSSPTQIPAVTGYDLCTGWGTPAGAALINALALPSDSLQVSSSSFASSGPVGGPFAPGANSYTLTNAGLRVAGMERERDPELALAFRDQRDARGERLIHGDRFHQCQRERAGVGHLFRHHHVYRSRHRLHPDETGEPERRCGAGHHQRIDRHGDQRRSLQLPDHRHQQPRQLRRQRPAVGTQREYHTGLISGTTTATGTSNVTISAINVGGTGSATLALTVLPPAPVITSTLTATATNGAAFSYQITATNSPTSYGASGLPSGLSVNTSSGLISGTTTATGTKQRHHQRDQHRRHGQRHPGNHGAAASAGITSASTATASNGHRLSATRSPPPTTRPATAQAACRRDSA
jgi:hypothetical protein